MNVAHLHLFKAAMPFLRKKEKVLVLKYYIISLFFNFAGCHGSHLFCFKPNASSTKAGTGIVLQPGPAKGNEKIDLNEVIMVPKRPV